MAFLGSPGTPAEFSELRNGIQVTGGDITDGSDNVIYNQTQNYIEQARLENSSITLSAGDGLQSLGSVSLGSSLTLNIEANDLTGSFLSEDGSNNLQVDLGRGLIDDPSNTGNIAFDESLLYTFTSEITLDAGASLGGVVDAAQNQIQNLPAPVDVGDAARKGYVDGVAQGLNLKESTVAASTQNIDLASSSDPRPIDGVSVQDGEAILLKDQTDATENGIYIANTAADPSSWTRAADFDESADITSGSFTFVQEGTENGSTSFTVISEDPIELGTDDILWDQFASAGEILAGTGLSKSGQTLSILTSDFIDAQNGLDTAVDGDIILYTDSSLTIDGSGQLTIATSNTNTFSAIQNFNAGLDVGADITDGSDTIYDSSAGEIPDAILGIIENSTLANDDVTINAGTGLQNGGTVPLGSSINIDIKPSDFIDTSKLSVSSGNITIDDIFLSNTGDTVSGSFTFGDFFDLEPIGEPGAPNTANMRVFMDSSDNNLKAKADDGSVVTLVTT